MDIDFCPRIDLTASAVNRPCFLAWTLAAATGPECTRMSVCVEHGKININSGAWATAADDDVAINIQSLHQGKHLLYYSLPPLIVILSLLHHNAPSLLASLAHFLGVSFLAGSLFFFPFLSRVLF